MKSVLRFLPVLFVALLVILPNFVSGQNNKLQLQKQKEKIEAEIRYMNQILKETQKTKRVSLNQVSILNNQIAKREELIGTITSEVGLIDKSIRQTNDTIVKLGKDIEKLKKEYAVLIKQSRKNRSSYSRLMYLFAAENFNQAYQRIKYFQQYSRFRQGQVREINSVQQELALKRAQLEEQKKQKLNLKGTEEQERLKLAEEKSEKNKQIQQLTQQEKDLRKKIQAQQRDAAKLQQSIEKIIAEEIRKAREAAERERKLAEARAAEKAKADAKAREEAARKAREEAIAKGEPVPEMKPEPKPAPKPEPARETLMSATPEEVALSSSFAGNKGRLPWPVEKGFISGQFGTHPHPLDPGIKVKNNGIDIMTSGGAQARAVFDGVVSTTMNMPSFGNVVIIKHGNFLTVYSHLSSVFVKKGDRVKTKQAIGKIETDEAGKSLINFQIWNANNVQNPAHWIAN